MSESFTYENLFAGCQQDVVNRAVTLLEGQKLTRGALLGRVLRTVPTTGTADDGNTGTGTITSVVGTAKTKLGVYRLVCTQAADAGPPEVPVVIAVYDPDGIRLEDAAAGAYAGAQLGFTATAGMAGFSLGDEFTIDVTAGSLKAKQADLDALDGADVPFGVLAEDADATDADVLTTCYVKGEFSDTAVGYAAGEDADDWREACAAVGILLRETVAA